MKQSPECTTCERRRGTASSPERSGRYAARVEGGDGDDAGQEQALTTPQAVSSTVAPQAAQAPPPKATLVLEAKGRSWLTVRNRGDARLFEGEVDAGWTRRFEDPVKLGVRIGNSAAVAVSCAGAPAQVPGAEGVALTLRCLPGGVQRP